MSECYYHGLEIVAGSYGTAIKNMMKIIEEGLKTRNEIRKFNDTNFNHICLYKKNNEYDYHEELSFLHSARGGWIDHCCVFIIHPDICARKAIEGVETNLVDEWRCYDDIPTSKFVGIALPFQSFNEYLDSPNNSEEERVEKETIRKDLSSLLSKAMELDLEIVNSDQEDFTDKFDENYSSNHLIK